jgi:phosphopantetheinyl transferase
VAGLGEPDRHEAIITCWVRAEAALKCTGQGIGHGLGGFPVRPAGTAAPGANGCTMRQLAAPRGPRAVALRAPASSRSG